MCKKNLPFSSDKSPDSAELTIKGAIEKKIHQASLSAQKAYDAVASSIESISIEAEASLLLQLPDSFEKESAVSSRPIRLSILRQNPKLIGWKLISSNSNAKTICAEKRIILKVNGLCMVLLPSLFLVKLA